MATVTKPCMPTSAACGLIVAPACLKANESVPLAVPAILLAHIYTLKYATWVALSTLGSLYLHHKKFLRDQFQPDKQRERSIMANKDNRELKTETMAETENYLAWRAEEPDGETTFHLELNNVTLHFFREEWEEFLELVRALE